MLNKTETSFYVKSGNTIDELPSALPNNSESFIFEGWKDESGDEITTETIIKHNYVLKPILVSSWEPQE